MLILGVQGPHPNIAGYIRLVLAEVPSRCHTWQKHLLHLVYSDRFRVQLQFIWCLVGRLYLPPHTSKSRRSGSFLTYGGTITRRRLQSLGSIVASPPTAFKHSRLLAALVIPTIWEHIYPQNLPPGNSPFYNNGPPNLVMGRR